MNNLEVFLDIDGCLIDNTYNLTAPLENLRKAAKKLEKKARVNLNSNRSLSGILKIWDSVRFNGLLIYENGLGIYDPILKIDNSSNQSELDRAQLMTNLASITEEFEFISTDDLVREPRNFRSIGFNKIYFEKTRKYTMTVYPRLFKENVPFIDSEYLLKVKLRLDEFYGQSYDIRISNSYGNVILVPKNALKSKPMKKIASGLKIASFGDETADICMFRESNPGLFGCPNNSQETVKEFVIAQGGFVPQKNYTLAVIDFFEYLNLYLRETRKK